MRKNRIGLMVIDKSDMIAELPDSYNASMERITEILEDIVPKIRELGARVIQLENETMLGK